MSYCPTISPRCPTARKRRIMSQSCQDKDNKPFFFLPEKCVAPLSNVWQIVPLRLRLVRWNVGDISKNYFSCFTFDILTLPSCKYWAHCDSGFMFGITFGSKSASRMASKFLFFMAHSTAWYAPKSSMQKQEVYGRTESKTFTINNISGTNNLYLQVAQPWVI